MCSEGQAAQHGGGLCLCAVLASGAKEICLSLLGEALKFG